MYLYQGTYIEFKDTEVPDAWLDSLPKGTLQTQLAQRHAKAQVPSHPSV